MLDRTLEFPADFVWGSAAAAHQVEGNNVLSDWWAHEHDPDTNAATVSGIACDHYNRYEADFRLLHSLGHRHHRMSVEWARIEPEEGRFDQKELDHYRAVLECLRGLGIEPWVTLHHFTLPLWFARKGGFTRRENVAAFARFVDRVGRAYGDIVSRWCTINEPTMHSELGHRFAYFPPRLADEQVAADVLRNLFAAHAAASQAVRASAPRSPEIGITLGVMVHEPLDPQNPADVAMAQRRDAEANESCFEALRTGAFRYPGRDAEEIPGLRESSTFVGIQYYTRTRYSAALGGPAMPDPARFITQMAWEVYPEGLAELLRRGARTGLAVYVTENGICCDDDRVRVEYIADHLAVVDQVRREGHDVRGYLYWSAMDNFEWNFGYMPKFGLIDVDRTTLARTARPSAHFFAEIIRTNRVTPELLSRYTVR